LIGATDLSNIIFVSKTEILEQLPRLTKVERHEIRLKLAELDGDDWIDGDDPLTADEKALLDARLAAYEKDPDAGSSWEEVESRIRARFTSQPSS
jgi:putative addiction module component (TIGR02574 family)